MKKWILLISMALSYTTFSQDFEREKMDRFFHLIDSADRGMGSISIFANGEEVYENAFGYRVLEDSLPLNTETQMHIGSISKTLSAVVIMKLVQEEVLTLDEKLSEYFPEFEKADEITIEQLLRHRSGIFNFTDAPDYAEWMEKPIEKKELINKLVRYGRTFPPDEKFGYSNANYVLLTFIAEQATGKDFNDLLQKHVCQPCELKHTAFDDGIDPEENEAYSYDRINRWEQSTVTDRSVPLGAGAIVSTPEDLNHFLYCLNKGELLDSANLKNMMTIQDGYGIGLFAMPFYEKKAYGHTGGIDGFRAQAFYFPEEDVSISYLSNAVSWPVNNIMVGALSIYFGRNYELPEFQPRIKMSADDLIPYPGTYAGPNFPMEIIVTRNGGQLMAKGSAQGQKAFPLTPVGDDVFVYEAAGVTLKFNPATDEMIFEQGGASYTLSKVKK
mgnify:CR=1 FL=1